MPLEYTAVFFTHFPVQVSSTPPSASTKVLMLRENQYGLVKKDCPSFLHVADRCCLCVNFLRAFLSLLGRPDSLSISYLGEATQVHSILRDTGTASFTWLSFPVTSLLIYQL